MIFSFKSFGLYAEGIIHVGAKEGSIAQVYSKEGVKRVLWIEKNLNLYGDLYKNTIQQPMEQLYYIQELSDKTNEQKTTFKNLWRKNPGEINIDAYDTLVISCKDNMFEILNGFEDFINLFKIIVLHDEIVRDKTHEFLLKNNFNEHLNGQSFTVYTKQ